MTCDIEELKQPHCFEFLVRTFCFTIPCGSGSCFCKQRKHQLSKVTCGQKRHTSWPATNYGYKDVIIIRTHQPQQNNPQQQPRRSKETSKLLATTNSRPNATLQSGCSCNMATDWLCSYRHATKYDCFQGITCNELPLLLRPRACNELMLLLRHRAVKKNTHAGEVRLLPSDHVQWITTAAAPSCVQWIRASAAPSCGQNKHTRWPRHEPSNVLAAADTVMQRITPAPTRSRAVNYRCCCAIVRSEKTHTLATTLACNRLHRS